MIEEVIGAAIRVHKELGPGLLESAYEFALMYEFSELGIEAARQVEVPVKYRGQELGVGFRADIIVSDNLLLELKAVDDFTAIHIAQLMTYLRLMNIKRGLLLNFNKKYLRDGIKRISI